MPSTVFDHSFYISLPTSERKNRRRNNEGILSSLDDLPCARSNIVRDSVQAEPIRRREKIRLRRTWSPVLFPLSLWFVRSNARLSPPLPDSVTKNSRDIDSRIKYSSWKSTDHCTCLKARQLSAHLESCKWVASVASHFTIDIQRVESIRVSRLFR